MNGYTKMMENFNITTDDSSDLPSSPKTPKAHEKFREIDTSMEDRDDEFTEKTLGAIKLQRNSSASSSTATSTALKQIFAVKRAWSMRRSSSVSERYCRIHDQHEALASPIHDGHESVNQEKMKSSSGKRLLRACVSRGASSQSKSQRS